MHPTCGGKFFLWASSADPVAAAWYGFTMCPVGLRLSDRGAVAWCRFTMCSVGLRLSDRGAAAWYGFTIYPVGLRLSNRGANKRRNPKKIAPQLLIWIFKF